MEIISLPVLHPSTDRIYVQVQKQEMLPRVNTPKKNKHPSNPIISNVISCPKKPAH